MGLLSSLFSKKAPSNTNNTRQTQLLTKSQKLILLSLAEGYKINGSNLPQYLTTKYRIVNARHEYQVLLSQGLIRESTNKESIVHLKNVELQSILSDMGLYTGGKKSELCSRINENVNDEQLDRYNIERYWMLTDAGKVELENNPYIDLYTGNHKYSLLELGIGYDEIATALTNISPKRYRDVVWSKFNDRSSSFYSNAMKTKNFHQYCELLRAMGLFLEEEVKYKEALHQYLRCEHYKVNFKGLLCALANYNISKKMKDASDAFMIEAELLPFEIDDIQRLKDECGLKQAELDSYMLDMLRREHDTGVFNPAEMVEFINCGLKKQTGKQRKMFENNFKKKVGIR